MPLTANLQLPYPDLSSENNPPADIQALTQALDGIGAWTDYNPTLSGIAGAATARYMRIGNLVKVVFLITASGAASGNILLSKPVTSASNDSLTALGSAMAVDGGAPSTRRSLTVVNASTSNVYFIVDSLASNASVATGVPWAWANTDTIGGAFEYEAAT